MPYSVFAPSQLVLLGLLFLITLASPAMAVTDSSVTPDDLTAGATTNYTVSFRPSVALDGVGTFGPDALVLLTGPGGPDFSGISLVSLSGGSITGSITTQAATQFTITLSGSGSVSAGTLVTFEISGVVNPGTAGQGPDYIMRTVEFTNVPPDIDDEVFAGSIYTASNVPVVVSPIPDLTGGNALAEEDGAQVIVNDLDTVFEDSDGDPLTFSIDPGNDPTVATASVNGSDALTVTPMGAGTTTITVRATSIDGFALDTFTVEVIGELDNASVTPQDLTAGATTTYDISFNTGSTIDTSRQIILFTGAGGPDYSGASLALSGGTLTGSLFNATNQAVGINITSGSAGSADTVQIELSGVLNPGVAGTGPDYLIRVTDLGLNDIERATVSGSVFGAASIPTVVNPIADQILNEIDGPQVIVADLNTVFDEADGEVLMFSIDPGNDPAVATASLNGSELTVTPTGPGQTDIAVRAADSQGSAVDTFQVSVVGIMDNATWTPASADTDAVTSYTLAFTTSSDLGPGQFLIVTNLAAGGPDYSSANLMSINGGSLSGSISAINDTFVRVQIDSGSASVGTPVTMVVGNAVNPSIGGPGPGYEARLFQLLPVVGDLERATLPPTQYVDVGVPMVTNPIGDQVINQADGPVALVSDLNSVFVDGNGQILTFSVLPANDPAIATGSINGDALSITPAGPGTTMFDIQASDLPAGGTGTAVDSFNLRVLGALTNATVTPADLEIDMTTSYTVGFQPALGLMAGERIVLATGLGGPDLSLASLMSITGGSLSASVENQSPTSISLLITGGNANNNDTVTVVLDTVINPPEQGIGPDYRIETRDTTNDLRSFAELPGSDYFDPGSIFFDDFEAQTRRHADR